jgi:hypothetical protein
MSVDQQQQKLKVIGCQVTEEELQNIIAPVMHDCHSLGLIKHDTVPSFARFCIDFWKALQQQEARVCDESAGHRE